MLHLETFPLLEAYSILFNNKGIMWVDRVYLSRDKSCLNLKTTWIDCKIKKQIGAMNENIFEIVFTVQLFVYFV